MTVPGGGGQQYLGAGSAAELEGTAISTIEMVGWTEQIASYGTDANAAVDYLTGEGANWAQDWPDFEAQTFKVYAGAVTEAIQTETIYPEDLPKATSWVQEQHGISSFTYKFIASGLLAAGLALWGYLNNRPGAKPKVPVVGAPPLAVQGARYGYEPGTVITTDPTTQLILAGVPVPLPDTAGGQVVVRAQTPIKRVKITNTGLDATQAKAVSLAIAEAYKDHITVLVNSVDHIEGQIAGIERQMADDRQLIRNDVKNLEHQINDVQAKIPTTAVGPPGPAGSPGPAGAPGPAGVPGTTLSPDQLASIAAVPAIAATATTAETTASTALQESTANQNIIQTSNLANQPTENKTLEDCCAENQAVTQPIRQGGATPSLLSQLGALLSKGFEVFLLAALIDAILAVVDLPDTIAGTLIDADLIEGYVERTANVILSDWSWAAKLHSPTL